MTNVKCDQSGQNDVVYIGYEDIDQGYKIDSFSSLIAWIIVTWKKISGSFQQEVNSLLPTHNMFLHNVLL